MPQVQGAKRQVHECDAGGKMRESKVMRDKTKGEVDDSIVLGTYTKNVRETRQESESGRSIARS